MEDTATPLARLLIVRTALRRSRQLFALGLAGGAIVQAGGEVDATTDDARSIHTDIEFALDQIDALRDELGGIL